MKELILTTAVLLCVTSQLAISAEPAVSSNNETFEFSPIVIDSKDGIGATVGAEYKFGGDLYTKNFETMESGASINPNAPIGSAVIGYSGNGTFATAKDRNPKNFLEFLIDAKIRYSVSKGTVIGGLFSKYETDQSFSNKQLVYGLRTTLGKKNAMRTNDFMAIDANYGRVDPADYIERKAVLVSGKLNPYYRWNIEFLYMYPLEWNAVRSLEFNYRYFIETNVPAPIKGSGLDKHELATLHIGLKNDLFIAYSAGKLPFDRKNDQIFQIGFSYKLN